MEKNIEKIRRDFTRPDDTEEELKKKPFEDTEKIEDGDEKNLSKERPAIGELNEAETKLEEAYEEPKEKRDEQQQEEKKKTPFEISQEAKSNPVKQENPTTSDAINNVASNNPVSEWFLNDRAEKLLKAMESVLVEVEKDLEDNSSLIDVGAGRGEITEGLMERFKDKIQMGIAIDTGIEISPKVKERMGDKLVQVFDDITKENKKINFKNRSVDLVAAFYLIEELNKDEKLLMFEELERIAKNGILLTTEIHRDGLKGVLDVLKYKILNGAKGLATRYETLEEDDLKELFEQACLKIEKEVSVGGNSMCYYLKSENEESSQ